MSPRRIQRNEFSANDQEDSDEEDGDEDYNDDEECASQEDEKEFNQEDGASTQDSCCGTSNHSFIQCQNLLTKSNKLHQQNTITAHDLDETRPNVKEVKEKNLPR